MGTSAHVDRFVRNRLPPPEQWPDLIFETPELQFPEQMNAASMLLDDAIRDGHGDRIAMVGEGIRWSYREVQRHVDQLARLLTDDMDLVPGNRVLLRGANSPWLAVCWLAVWKAGGVAVGAMPLLRAKELRPIVELAQISHALCEATLAEELVATQAVCSSLQRIVLYGTSEFERLLATKPESFAALDTAADDPALIAFTSGTTGIPKGCIHTHRDVMAMCEVFPRHCLRPEASDVFIGTPPLAFTFGLGGLLCFPMWARACTVLLERLTPDALLAAMAKYHATVCFTSPTAYKQMTGSVGDHDLGYLKKCVSAGEPLPTSTRDQWRSATGIQILDGIGGTEVIHIYIASDPTNYRVGAIGKVLPGYRACVVDENMRPMPVGETGWLALKGPTGCRYLADDRQTRYVREGWNLTGDTFHMDAEGYYYFHARNDDIIVTSGYNVSSPEVESVLLEHPAVTECGVVGVPDPDRGQILKAFIVLKPGVLGSQTMIRELQDYVKQHAAPYKYPRAISFVAALPRTETGKLQRFKLKEGS